MTDNANPENNAPTSNGVNRSGGRKRRWFGLVGVAMLSALAGGFATKAFSHGHGWRGHFGHGSGLIMVRGEINPERAAKRATRMAKHLGVEVDATAEQQAKLNEIASGLVSDMLPLRKKLSEARKRGVDLVTAETVDRSAIEAFRQEQMATADEMTQRLASALTDAAEVLTPDQRKILAERVADFRERRGWFGRHHWRR